METARPLGIAVITAVVTAFTVGLGCIPDVTGAKCVKSDTCPDGQTCVGGLCSATGTGTGGGGGGGGAAGCTSTAQCANGSRCLRGLCTPVGCSLDAGCTLAGNVAGACIDFAPLPRCLQRCVGVADSSCPTGTSCVFADSRIGYVCFASSPACPACVGGQCSTGSSCSKRTCDGLPGCFRDDDPYCSTIGGKALPQVCNFGICTSASECGEASDCLDSIFDGGPSRCVQLCASSSECAVSGEFGAATSATCTDLGTNNYCVPACGGLTDLTTCPTKSFCRAERYCDF